mmetsp:Transcript_23496/g.51407  ORF Transcript_23496/g.51407 Transcript_23496/m.51407 type:complete len:152 (+) Transcript_23496:189-644(+)
MQSERPSVSTESGFASELRSFVHDELGMDLGVGLSCVFCKVAFTNSRLTRAGKCEIKILHCLHSACGPCLEEFLGDQQEVMCPICDARTGEQNYNKYLCNFAVHQGIDHRAIEEERVIACDVCLEAPSTSQATIASKCFKALVDEGWCPPA